LSNGGGDLKWFVKKQDVAGRWLEVNQVRVHWWALILLVLKLRIICPERQLFNSLVGDVAAVT
jgi:hypothetical protein